MEVEAEVAMKEPEKGMTSGSVVACLRENLAQSYGMETGFGLHAHGLVELEDCYQTPEPQRLFGFPPAILTERHPLVKF